MAPKRAAHRPSRKHAVVEAAMHLYATKDPSAITVADIAAQAAMSAAAVYYHYATKEDVLLEGLLEFAQVFSNEVAVFLCAGDTYSLANLPVHLLDVLDQHRDAAIIWFTHDDELSTAAEARRRITNEVVIAELVKAVKANHPEYPLPHACVVAVGLFSVVEISARAWLTRELRLVEGREYAFRGEVAALAARILASPVPVK
ncbi:TetR/AcrR family transcriptional regulator [Mycolicibacterium hodleri]|uniref:TetR/AcrR family transcriptional regulator n=1 Tax=Mycolicibacterium hodleri TaxID=49897 RepID=UPI001375AB06|nr:TetR/AcrR family transcriptional regulator [Mycolicibacterium hodleri]